MLHTIFVFILEGISLCLEIREYVLDVVGMFGQDVINVTFQEFVIILQAV